MSNHNHNHDHDHDNKHGNELLSGLSEDGNFIIVCGIISWICFSIQLIITLTHVYLTNKYLHNDMTLPRSNSISKLKRKMSSFDGTFRCDNVTMNSLSDKSYRTLRYKNIFSKF